MDSEIISILITIKDVIFYILQKYIFLSVFSGAFFVILYSLEWGSEKANAWLVSFCLSFFQSVLLVQPLKVSDSCINSCPLKLENSYKELVHLLVGVLLHQCYYDTSNTVCLIRLGCTKMGYDPQK